MNDYYYCVRFWWLKIEACGEAGDWMELDRHCKSQKSPIGYEVRKIHTYTNRDPYK